MHSLSLHCDISTWDMKLIGVILASLKFSQVLIVIISLGFFSKLASCIQTLSGSRRRTRRWQCPSRTRRRCPPRRWSLWTLPSYLAETLWCSFAYCPRQCCSRMMELHFPRAWKFESSLVYKMFKTGFYSRNLIIMCAIGDLPKAWRNLSRLITFLV